MGTASILAIPEGILILVNNHQRSTNYRIISNSPKDFQAKNWTKSNDVFKFSFKYIRHPFNYKMSSFGKIF